MTDADLALIDRAQLAELDAMLGQATTDTLVAPMLVELADAPVAIRDFILGGKIAAARSAAHGLRGAALGLGCLAVADLCGRIEDAAADAIPGLAEDLMPVAERTAAVLRLPR